MTWDETTLVGTLKLIDWKADIWESIDLKQLFTGMFGALKKSRLYYLSSSVCSIEMRAVQREAHSRVSHHPLTACGRLTFVKGHYASVSWYLMNLDLFNVFKTFWLF